MRDERGKGTEFSKIREYFCPGGDDDEGSDSSTNHRYYRTENLCDDTGFKASEFIRGANEYRIDC